MLRPAVTRSYYGRDEATLLAKIPDAEGEGYSHRMGDLGYLDENFSCPKSRAW